MSVHICVPRADMRQIVRADSCPDPVCPSRASGRRPFLVRWHEEWYGFTDTCLSCGRQWMDGEWMALSFERHARRDSIARAKAYYKRLIAANVPTTVEGMIALHEDEWGAS